MKKLEWDSEFWGIDIFNLAEDDSFYQQGLIDSGLDGRDNFLIQALISDIKVEQINLLEQRGFRFIESKITLKKLASQTEKICNLNFKLVTKEEIICYRNELFDLYLQVSRFYFFPNEKINDFYYKWAINSIEGKMDDKCIGYYIDNRLSGFITYKTINKITKVGLIGVFSEFQNRGISQQLLGYLNNEVINMGLSEIFISTQGKNLQAINAYIKNGFYFDNIMHWYYLIGGK